MWKSSCHASLSLSHTQEKESTFRGEKKRVVEVFLSSLSLSLSLFLDSWLLTYSFIRRLSLLPSATSYSTASCVTQSSRVLLESGNNELDISRQFRQHTQNFRSAGRKSMKCKKKVDTEHVFRSSPRNSLTRDLLTPGVRDWKLWSKHSLRWGETSLLWSWKSWNDRHYEETWRDALIFWMYVSYSWLYVTFYVDL